MWRQLAAATATLVLVAACSSNGKQATTTTSLSRLCTKLGNTFTEEPDEHELFTSDEGSCGQLRLYAFNGDQPRDDWLRGAKKIGGNYLVGDRWVVTSDDPSLIAPAQAKVGGHIQP